MGKKTNYFGTVVLAVAACAVCPFVNAQDASPGNRVTDPTLRSHLAENKALIAAAVAKLPPNPPGPVQPTWESIRANFKDPEWFRDAKFGIMMHWGVYSVPAHGSEWYERDTYD